jgi:hypothetical protein
MRSAGYSDTQIAAELESRGLTAPERGAEVLPGVRTGIETSDPEVRAIRDSFAGAASRGTSLTAVEEIGRRYGPRSVIDPRAAAELAPHMLSLRAMAADLQGSGIINPGEVPVINAALPSPDSLRGQTFGTVQGSMRQWRQLLESKVSAGLRARGVNEAGVRRAVGAMWSGGRFEAPRASQQQQSTEGRVQMRSPNGSTRWVAPDRVDFYRDRGAEVVE